MTELASTLKTVPFSLSVASSKRLEIPEGTMRNEPKDIKSNLIVGRSFLLADNSNTQDDASRLNQANDVK